jgi:hypothetical protein
MKHVNKSLWYCAVPLLSLAVCVLSPGFAQAQMTSVGIDCSQVGAMHLLQQDNQRAGLALMECGVIPRHELGGTTNKGGGNDDPTVPPNVLISNRSCTSNGSCTRSESMVYRSQRAGDNTVVTNFHANYGSGSCYGGLAYSTDGGNTFTEEEPTCTRANYGDPIVVFNLKLNKWFVGDLAASDCGGLGIGLWTSPDGINWTQGACAHVNSNDDRESFWVDNNPFSSKYGRMYISFNNFNVDGGALFVTHSDDGVTWSTPTQLSTSFIRDVQLTGTPPGPPLPSIFTSTVFVASMDEMGGGLGMRQNHIFRSMDGGNTFTNITMGAAFEGPGDGVCSSNSYFAKMNPIWRHMGWGEPGVGPNGVVHYAYAGKGTLSTGDIFYTRSTDNGNTWSTPIVLNDPETNQFQSHWMPSLSVNYNPAAFTQPQDVTVTWYDRRQSTTACNNVTDPGCNYQRYGVQSNDNGNTFGANFAVSDQIIPEPSQNNDLVQPCYAGDYDYATAYQNSAYVTWDDGRVTVGGAAVQSIEGDVVPEP